MSDKVLIIIDTSILKKEHEPFYTEVYDTHPNIEKLIIDSDWPSPEDFMDKVRKARLESGKDSKEAVYIKLEMLYRGE